MTTWRTRLRGLSALLLLAAIVIGLPVTLLALGANPLHASLPDWQHLWSFLTSPDDGTLALDAIKVVGWVAWVFLTGSVLLEVAARARGAQVPHLKGLGWSQRTAHGLVGAALLLFTATPAIAPTALAAPVGVTATQHVTAPTVTAALGTTVSAEAATTTSDTARVQPTVKHVVQPGESPWSIAHDKLGSGSRYTEIIALNHDLVGDNGFLRTGWVLRIPADSHPADPPASPTTSPASSATHRYTVRDGDTLSQIAAKHLGNPDRYMEIFTASTHTLQPDGHRLTDPNKIETGWVLTLPGPGPAAAASTSPAPRQTQQSTPEAPQLPTVAAAIPAPAPAKPAPPVTDTSPTSSPAAPSPTASDTHDATDAHQLEQEAQQHDDGAAAPWMLAGFTGAGIVLAAGALVMLKRRRQAQFRARRPGRTIAIPEAALAPVEKTILAAGSTAAPSVEQLDAVLKDLASVCRTQGLSLPAVAAIELGSNTITAHLADPATLPAPWQPTESGLRWVHSLNADPDNAPDAAALPGEAVAPYPLLVSAGVDDTGNVWLLNFEQLGQVTITGDRTYAEDFARYLAAEIALNPWSQQARVDLCGIAAEVEQLNPERVRYHHDTQDVVRDAVADAVAMIDRTHNAGTDVITGRGTVADDDSWPARLLLLDAGTNIDVDPAFHQLRELISTHPERTGTTIVLATENEPGQGVTLRFTRQGRLVIPDAGLDLIAAGLTSDEAFGCAALFTQADDLHDVPIPVDPTADDGWRALVNEAGALREENTLDRADPDPDAVSVLPEVDQEYLDRAATTTGDLATLAPAVAPHISVAVQDADPTLDADLHAWFSSDCPLPRLSVLGPVTAHTKGAAVAVARRKPYAVELLTYLATRPHGATPAEVAAAFDVSEARVRNDIKMVRDWLGTNPLTGQKHLPNARESRAAKTRGIGVYEVQDVLLDADLFRRLRVRGQSRGPEGLADLRRALQLVQGQPFSQLRPAGWTWLTDGDRLDHHMTCAIVDVAHIVATAALHDGDLPCARAAAEVAMLAAPYEEIPRLDLAAVATAEGHPDQARRILRDEVANRSDDGQAPTEMPVRSETILAHREWLKPDTAAS